MDSDDQPGEQSAFSAVASKAKESFQSVYTLSTHDKPNSEDALVNKAMFPAGVVREGTIIQITTLQSPPLCNEFSEADCSSSYLFYVKFADSGFLSKQPNLQVSVHQSIASALHLERGSAVLLSTEDEVRYRASHVEVVFRNQYLTRADMWRLINRDLMGKCVYRGQSIELIGTVKAVINNIFIAGRKVNSALFHASTKPIFRSESARYVLLIQLAKEMWEFDTEGTGEIMYDKVVNGFLPELFRRWQQMQVRHLVSIVFFTRMEYDSRPPSQPKNVFGGGHRDEASNSALSRDYYRVVVSDMASSESASILDRLKKEFQVFLRDTTIRKPSLGDFAPLACGLSAASAVLPRQIISGHPCTAVRGNILEAINLASSQFATDNVDRDLVRTGVSIVIITPGTGLFEVDYKLLVTTTDTLTDNGVGIDLVCLSRMPLHSVPLFKYRKPIEKSFLKDKADDLRAHDNPLRKFLNTMSEITPSFSSVALNQQPSDHDDSTGGWHYGVPHWVDVSFWMSAVDQSSDLRRTSASTKGHKTSFDMPTQKPFRTRVRIYELQMMGVMENGIRDISIPILPHPPQSSPNLARLHIPLNSPASTGSFHKSSTAGSLRSEEWVDRLQTPKLSASPVSVYGDQRHENQASLRWMDEYDDVLFCHPRVTKFRPRKAIKQPQAKKDPKTHRKRRVSAIPVATGNTDRTNDERKNNMRLPSTASRQERHSALAYGSHKTHLAGATSRKISFGPRGLGVGAPKVAAAIADTSPVGRDVSGVQLQQRPASQLSDTSQVALDPIVNPQGISPGTPVDMARKCLESPREESHSSDDLGLEASRPIPIRKATAMRIMRENRDHHPGSHPEAQDRVAALRDMRDIKGPEISGGFPHAYGPQLPTISPSTSVAPWLTVLNPCNPPKMFMESSGRLGRWHHIFPRPLHAPRLKWKSLSSPAAVPLTTEDFPSADQFAEEYRERSYLVTLPEDMDLRGDPGSLVNELLAFRLARGFQIVVGDRVADALANPSLRNLDIFNDKILARPESSIILSRGSAVHHLKRMAPDRIEIKIHLRHNTAKVNDQIDDAQVFYAPLIRSMLADDYKEQQIPITPYREAFDWLMIDSFIAGHERLEAAQYVEKLRPWRARFVLIPINAPGTSRRRNKSNEDTEEEVRLEGIQKLTQIWQKASYVAPHHRRFAAPAKLQVDANPLEVRYYTKNPSAVIADELENAAIGFTSSASIQLLPETDLYQRSTLDIKSLAAKLQSEKGVRLKDRRWHLKTHHDCFIGSELTTWLVENFRDVRNREEAVELGNLLIKDGLFKHVEGRHEFRDGHYFYHMGDEYRVSRPETKGLFGWGKGSVPPTPLSSPDVKKTNRSRSNSDVKAAVDSESSKPPEKGQRLSVALGKSLIYNLDERHKRSYRKELVNLHYDRLHHPDNCYHIRLEWMNTTPKMIQDAIVHWARSVEPHGLRLVEVPISEACSISSMHPFRAPYLIKLAQEPPPKQPTSYFDTKSFTLKVKPAEKNFYQKALLGRFDFVLDFEAASEFPAEVDVTYSWGKPDYRYSQYIHRSGLLLAQITDEGHFLLLANRLYNNRSSSARTRMADNLVDRNFERNPIFYRPNPLRDADGLRQSASPKASPSSSPAVPAALGIPTVPTSRTHSPWSNISLPQEMLQDNHSISSSYGDPEKLTRDFQHFCQDIEALKSFYSEQLSKGPSPIATTPAMGGKKVTNDKVEPSLEENRIPDLTLPGSLRDKEQVSQ
ncbi:MAG: hypothetical protein Q9163_002182 [Psora crenata]